MDKTTPKLEPATHTEKIVREKMHAKKVEEDITKTKITNDNDKKDEPWRYSLFH